MTLTKDEIKAFDEFLRDSFKGGVFGRELRLSGDEVEYLKDQFPRARLEAISSRNSGDGKLWYMVELGA